MWSCPTNNISSSPKWDSFGWSFCSPNKHALNPGPTMTHCKEDMSAWKTCPLPIHICSLKDAMSAQVAGWPALSGTTNRSFRCKETKNLYIMAAATLWSSRVFSWVEEAADVGKQGCNPKHGDANDVSVGTHVAKGTLTAASRLHLHGRCPQRLLQRGASCSRTGSGAHKAKHRRAGKGQEHASEHTWGGASHVASFATQRAAQERPSKRSSWNKLKPKSSRSPMWIQTR